MSIHILALDTATEACSVALMLDNNILLKRFKVVPQKHTQYILPMIDSLLEEANITLNNLNALAFSRGPGSFTGIRIGVGIAQGLALGANLPVIGVSTLAILAEGAWRRTGICQVLTAIDARMGEIYWAPYKRQNGIWLGEELEVVAKPEELKHLRDNLSGCWAIAGTGWKKYPKLFHHDKLTLIESRTLLPNAQDILPLALYYYCHYSTKSLSIDKPVYLRDKIAYKNYKIS